MKETTNGARTQRDVTTPGRREPAELQLDHARATVRQLRQLLDDVNLRKEPELRLALADELLREVEALGLKLHRPTVRQTAARVRRAIGLPSQESAGGVQMSVDTAMAFLSLAVDPPAQDAQTRQAAG